MSKKNTVVLVVEDEALIRMSAVDVLNKAGFTVLEAYTADDALITLQSRAGEIEAIFADVHMPGVLSGLELARQAKLRWPWIAVLITSGAVRPLQVPLPRGTRFLPKPYDAEEMVRHIRELVGSRR